MGLWDKVDEVLINNWNSIVDSNVPKKIISKERAEELFIKTLFDKEFMLELLKDDLVKPIVDDGAVTNAFIAFSPVQGNVCNNHDGLPIICVYIHEGVTRVNQDYAVRLPFIEDIMNMKTRDENMVEKLLGGRPALAIQASGPNALKYEHYCATCNTWGDITYSEDIGLRFENPTNKGSLDKLIIDNDNNTSTMHSDKYTPELIDETFNRGDKTVITIPHEFILNKNIEYFRETIKAFHDSKVGPYLDINIIIQGYDNDPRELYAIPEVKEYVNEAIRDHYKYLAIFCNMALNVFVACKAAKISTDLGTGRTRIALEGTKAFDFINKLKNKCNSRYKFKLDTELKILMDRMTPRR